MSIKDFAASMNATMDAKVADGTKEVCGCGTEASLTTTALEYALGLLENDKQCPLSLLFIGTIIVSEAADMIKVSTDPLTAMMASVEVMGDAKAFHKSVMGQYLTTKTAIETGIIPAEKVGEVWDAFKQHFPDFEFPTHEHTH